jgi:hypothetical protein
MEEVYKREDYTVRRHWVQQIVKIMGLEKCTFIDMFASKWNARFAMWVDKRTDALQVPWPPDSVIWCNPPWSLLEQLPEKMQRERRCCLVIMPAWSSKKWQWTILAWSRKVIYFERGTRIFEVDGHPCQGIRWPLYACYVPQEAFDVQVNQVMQQVGPSARRKMRRRRKRAAWPKATAGGGEASPSQACDQGCGGIPAFGGPWEDNQWW